MTKSKTTALKAVKDESLELAKAAVEGCLELKANDVLCLDLRSLNNAVADFFIICHADSKTQVEAIARSVEDEVHKIIGEWPFRVEGTTNAEWILVDYSNVIVHVFQTERRQYYGLENLWADAEQVTL